jgi:DNA-binding CsgD family transcriptional regulator
VRPVCMANETPIEQTAEDFDNIPTTIYEVPPAEPFPTLTPREREVALHICEGKTCREIAELIGCSLKTVDAHRGSLLRKLEIKNAVLLTLYAVREGWIIP